VEERAARDCERHVERGDARREEGRRSKAPERTRRPGGSTGNDDRPLFPPSGLNYYHPAEHCLLWWRIILLSLGRPASPSHPLTLSQGARRALVRALEGSANGKAEERPCSGRGSAIYRFPSCGGKPRSGFFVFRASGSLSRDNQKNRQTRRCTRQEEGITLDAIES
jgi:hypothetical protein